MAKPERSAFVCQSCGAIAARWAGKCAACGEWNTLLEEAGMPAGYPTSGRSKAGKARTAKLLSLAEAAPAARRRLPTGSTELDRVTGGGIGKSTLLLQLAAAFAKAGRRALYFTGEEAASQVRLRAERLGLATAPVALAAETNVANIVATLEAERGADLVVIDSIQTLWAEALDAAPGSVAQVRLSTQILLRHAKATGSALVLVGHVTKDGQIAGPKVIEHMVDTVLTFEGERGHPFRILRATKNRFGASEEIAVFEMAGEGLREVLNPSALFLGDRTEAPGSAIFAGVEGTRPLLMEVQALVVPAAFGTPRRAVVGGDANRLAMVLAILDARCGVGFQSHDVYLNVAGGLKLAEPAADLAVAAALLSSISNVALSPDQVYFGELSLSGAVRPASHALTRLKEAEKLGFKHAVLPAAGEVHAGSLAMALKRISHIKELAAGGA
jgi:DNA repair protein RadA/Sms